MEENKIQYNINSVEDYLDVGLDPGMIINYIEETPLEQFKPIYVTAYFLLKRDLVSS